MKELSKKELCEIQGGGISLGLGILIGAGVIFILGLIDGYTNPMTCNN